MSRHEPHHPFPHPLAALFGSADGTGEAPDTSVTGTPAEAHEVFDAELLDDLDPGADGDDNGEDVIDVWETHTPGDTGP